MGAGFLAVGKQEPSPLGRLVDHWSAAGAQFLGSGQRGSSSNGKGRMPWAVALPRGTGLCYMTGSGARDESGCRFAEGVVRGWVATGTRPPQGNPHPDSAGSRFHRPRQRDHGSGPLPIPDDVLIVPHDCFAPPFRLECSLSLPRRPTCRPSPEALWWLVEADLQSADVCRASRRRVFE